MTKRTKLLAALGLSAALVAGAALARPNNGDMGVFLDANGNVVGTWVMSCDGQYSWSGQRGTPVKNGQLFCNPR